MILTLILFISCTPIVSECLLKKSQWRNVLQGKNLFLDNAHPLTGFSPTDTIGAYGYPSETHVVETSDGHYITLFRIPTGVDGKHNRTHMGKNVGRRERQAVILVHGIFSSAYHWLINSKENNLPFKLVDGGYDVWIYNARGSPYSRKHKEFKDTEFAFWDFSFHELGLYDMTACIDYIRSRTGHQRLHYIGYSMGTSLFFAMMSERPEYNDKIKFMVALSPGINYTSGATTLKQAGLYFQKLSPRLNEAVRRAGNGELPPPMVTKAMNSLGTLLCSNKFLAATLCKLILDGVVGPNPDSDDLEHMGLGLGTFPGPGSWKTVNHFLQYTHPDTLGHFTKFDYGTTANRKIYGQNTPPLYNLSRTRVPVAVIYEHSDSIVPPLGVPYFAKQLPNLVYMSQVNSSKWTHINFVLAKNANKFLNEPILELLRLYK